MHVHVCGFNINTYMVRTQAGTTINHWLQTVRERRTLLERSSLLYSIQYNGGILYMPLVIDGVVSVGFYYLTKETVAIP